MATPVSPQPNNGTPTPNGKDRRRFPRFNMALDVAFGVAGPDGRPTDPNALERTVSVNLSLGGLCLYSEALYPLGSQLYCQITLPGHPDPLEVTTTIVWFQKVNHNTRGYKLGLEFVTVSAEAQRVLERLVTDPPVAQASRAKTLLLVDDDQELQLALKLRFESAGFRVITAKEGLEALRKGREEHPNIIVLDLMLPKLNGYEVCRMLKFDQKFSHIPIVLFTARSRQEDLEMGYAVGADSFITKPFDGADLIERIEELLTKDAAP